MTTMKTVLVVVHVIMHAYYTFDPLVLATVYAQVLLCFTAFKLMLRMHRLRKHFKSVEAFNAVIELINTGYTTS